MHTVFTMPKYHHIEGFLLSLADRFEREEGTLIYDGRNQLREFNINGIMIVVKSFAIPSIINRIAYGFIRSSKAQRSCEYAKMLIEHGISSPEPVGYLTERKGLLFNHSYYACLKSENPYNFNDIVAKGFADRNEHLRAIARTTAKMHECGYLHTDYSAGNILTGKKADGTIGVEIIDLNRIRFKRIGLEMGCKNFERLPMNDEIIDVIGRTYAEARHFDAQQCINAIKATYRYKI